MKCYCVVFVIVALVEAARPFNPLHHSFHPTAPTPYNPATPTPYPTSPPTTPVPLPTLPYYGGAVLGPIPTVYLLYYGDWNTLAPGSIGIIDGFFSNLNGSSLWGLMTGFYSVDSVTGNKTYLSNQFNFGGSVLYNNYTVFGTQWASAANGHLGASDVVSYAIGAGFFPYDPRAVYLVTVTHDVSISPSYCQILCGYHNYAYYNQTKRFYYGVSGANGYCGVCTKVSNPAPDGDANAHAIVNVLWHELVETVSDPDNQSWLRKQSDLEESADLCNFKFGSTYTTGSGATANVHIGSHDYYVQTIWSPLSNACVLA